MPKDSTWRTFLFHIEVYICPEVIYYFHYTFSAPIMAQTLKSRKNFQIQKKKNNKNNKQAATAYVFSREIKILNRLYFCNSES